MCSLSDHTNSHTHMHTLPLSQHYTVSTQACRHGCVPRSNGDICTYEATPSLTPQMADVKAVCCVYYTTTPTDPVHTWSHVHTHFTRPMAPNVLCTNMYFGPSHLSTMLVKQSLLIHRVWLILVLSNHYLPWRKILV